MWAGEREGGDVCWETDILLRGFGIGGLTVGGEGMVVVVVVVVGVCRVVVWVGVCGVVGGVEINACGVVGGCDVGSMSVRGAGGTGVGACVRVCVMMDDCVALRGDVGVRGGEGVCGGVSGCTVGVMGHKVPVVRCASFTAGTPEFDVPPLFEVTGEDTELDITKLDEGH